jgi:hypothetical protein
VHLLNVSVAVASALVGTFGATVAYGTMNTTPVVHTEPMLEPVRLTHYLPCESPARLVDGVCVTTVVKTVVKTAEPVVITTVEERRSSKGKAAPSRSAGRDDDDEDEDEDDEDHEDEDHEDEDHDD